MSNEIYFGAINSEEIIINKNELAQRLQCPCELAFSYAKPFLPKLLKNIECKFAARECDIHITSNRQIQCDFGELAGKDIVSFLEKYKKILVFAVTLGAGVDIETAKLSHSPAEAFIFDALASAAADAAADKVQALVTQKAAPYKRFSPGYGDLDISCQKALLDFLNATDIGITLSEAIIMSPSKTITAIVGVE